MIVPKLDRGDKLKFAEKIFVVVNVFNRKNGEVRCIMQDEDLNCVYEETFQRVENGIDLDGYQKYIPTKKVGIGKKIILDCGLTAEIKDVLSQSANQVKCLISIAGSFSQTFLTITT